MKILLQRISKEADNIYLLCISNRKRLVIKREYIDTLEGFMYSIISVDVGDNTYNEYYSHLAEIIEKLEAGEELSLPLELMEGRR